jgi:hypothetical protein
MEETLKARKIKIGDKITWIPKSQSKLDGGNLQISTWIYEQNIGF